MSVVPRLIIFDCDGTLVDSQHIIHAAMTHAYREEKLPPPQRHETLRVVGLSLVEAISAISPQFELSLCEQLADRYKKSFVTLRADKSLSEPMFEGAAGLLQDLQKCDEIQLGIATGKSRRGVDSFLKRESLHGVFDTIQTADDAPSKPDPSMLEQALLETGSSPHETVMIGDTTFDMTMAKNAGVKPIGVSWGYHEQEELLGAGAHEVAGCFSHLKDVLGMR